MILQAFEEDDKSCLVFKTSFPLKYKQVLIMICNRKGSFLSKDFGKVLSNLFEVLYFFKFT